MKEDLELKEFRDLMPAPDHWDEGFGIKAMIGGVFVGLVMTPASMYMNLVVGSGMGSAAQWVTVILFIEMARRSFTSLRRPEIYVLYYMAGASLVSGSGLLWSQYLVQCQPFRAVGLADKIPAWVAPHDPAILGTRSLFHHQWLAPVGLLILGQCLGRLDYFGLGYVMYRLTSDVERLPFPMAPVGAMGVTALADASGGQDTWRWRVFSFGSMLGMVFGAVYFALPAITGACLPEPINIIPLPWTDLTGHTERILKAVPFILSLDLGLLISGMVLPYWAMVGSFCGVVMGMIANPIMYHYGILHTWKPGVGAITTIQANTLDFYLSFGIGLTAAIAAIGIYHVGNGLLKKNRALDEHAAAAMNWKRLFHPPAGRGDFSIFIAIGIYLFSTTANIVLACLLLGSASRAGLGSPLTKTLVAVLFFYGFIYTPILSYVSARMEGIVGMGVQVPFVREATFILSGYRGAAIWFTPFPANNYGSQCSYFRQTELTGTRIRSMMKAEMFILPVVLIATLAFTQFIWRLAPIPSSAFPAAQKVWELRAFQQALIFSSTLPGNEHGPFYQALMPLYIACGFGLAILTYAILAFFGLPVLMVYGVIRGMDGSAPDVILPQFAGALLGRYFFARRFGKMWPQYRVVFFAGYSCGFGLICMLSLGLVFMTKCVLQSQY